MRIKTGHLRGFAPDQGAAVVLAGVSQSFHDFLGNFRLELAGCEIVHEKHGRGALDGNIVHTVVHQVGADGVVHVHFKGEFQLGTDAVHARNQHRIGILGLVHGEQSAKAANFAEHALGESLVGKILDTLLGAVCLVNIDPGVSVSDGLWGILGHDASVYEMCGSLILRKKPSRAAHCSTSMPEESRSTNALCESFSFVILVYSEATNVLCVSFSSVILCVLCGSCLWVRFWEHF